MDYTGEKLKNERSPLLEESEQSHWKDAWLDADYFIVSLLPICSEDRRNICCSPWYYLLLAPLAVVGFIGHEVHTFFGQPGKIRGADELPQEYEARTQWVYQLTGAFALAIVFLIPYILYLEFTHSSLYLDYSFAVALYVAYIIGNVLFMRAMRQRHRLHTRLAIIANAGFAAGLITTLVYGSIVYTDSRDLLSAQIVLVWFFRGFIVFLFIAQTAIYAQLWSLYPPQTLSDNNDEEMTYQSCVVEICQDCLLVIAAIVVWLFFVFALSFKGGYEFIWIAL